MYFNTYCSVIVIGIINKYANHVLQLVGAIYQYIIHCKFRDYTGSTHDLNASIVVSLSILFSACMSSWSVTLTRWSGTIVWFLFWKPQGSQAEWSLSKQTFPLTTPSCWMTRWVDFFPMEFISAVFTKSNFDSWLSIRKVLYSVVGS